MLAVNVLSIASLVASVAGIVLAVLGSILDEPGFFTAAYVIHFAVGIPLAFAALALCALAV